MQTQQQMLNSGAAHGLGERYPERRRHPRHESAARARVQGADARGEKFSADAEIKDISAGGLYVRLAEQVEPGELLTAEVALGSGGSGGARGLRVCARVLRAERLIDGRYGVAAVYTGHNFTE